MPVKIEVLQPDPLFTNSVLISNGSDCVIFDPWGLASYWTKILSDQNLNLRGIYITHGHYDHISAAPALALKYNVNWYMNQSDFFLVDFANVFLPGSGLPLIPTDYKKPIDISSKSINLLPALSAKVTKCPGHSPGGLAFYLKSENTLIVGDTLFQDCVGRWDLPGANKDDLLNSVSSLNLLGLPDDTVVIHGHGPNTTIGWLKLNNPYFKPSSIFKAQYAYNTAQVFDADDEF